MNIDRANLPVENASGPAGPGPAAMGGRGMLALLFMLVGSAGLWAAIRPDSGVRRADSGDDSESSAPAAVIEKRFTKTAAPVICQGMTPVVERIEVVNDTGQPVLIKQIERSCGCLEAKLDKQRLEPGETADLTMRVELSPRGERRTVAANVVTENAGYWRFELAVAGYPLLEFPQDIEHLNAGEVQPGGELVKQATLYTHSLAPAEPPEIASATAEAAGARIEFENGEPEPAAEGVLRRPVKVTLRIPPERLAGRYMGTAAFAFDRDASAAQSTPAPLAARDRNKTAPSLSGNAEPIDHRSVPVRWSYSWHVASRYEVEPRRIFISGLAAEAGVRRPERRTLHLRRAGGEGPLLLKGATADHAFIRVASVRTVGSSAEIDVVIDLTTFDSRAFYGRLELLLADPAEPLITVPVSCLLASGVNEPPLAR